MSGGLVGQLNGLLVKHQRSGVLLDTNVLLLLLIAQFDSGLVGGKRLEKYDAGAADLLVGFASRFDRLLTTTTVLTETSNLLGQVLGSPRRQQLFSAVFPVFDASHSDNIRRLAIDAPATDREVFVRLGYADSSLVAALSEANGLLLTDDLDLFLEAQRCGIDAVNFTHMREAAGLL